MNEDMEVPNFMRTLSLCLFSLSLLGVSACSSEPSAEATNAVADEDAGADPAVAGASSRLESSVDGLTIAAATSIPIFKGGQDEPLCFDPAPQTRQGESVQARGWQVTGEIDLGEYQLVSFVGKMEPGTSGSCLMQDGNIALFQGGDVKAIIYSAKGAKASIGSIERLEQGNVRILDGDYLAQPMADLNIGEDGAVRIEKPAASESVCNGKGKIPNIYDQPINRARSLLREAGWEPSQVQRSDESRARSLAANGITEVDSCSGTGFGYCAFLYEGRAGKLSVTTAGEDEWPKVVRYSAQCSG